MSAGFPYLQKLRKSDLTEFAEATNLPGYADLKKVELEVALDEHLRTNQAKYQNNDTLSDYYRRLAPKTTVKKVTERVVEAVRADDEPVVKKARRKTKSPEDIDEGEGTVSALMKTPGKELTRHGNELARRTSALTQSLPMPPSPAVVTDAIDRQTTRLRNSISDVYQRSNIHEYSDLVRDLLSSPVAVVVLGVAYEAFGLRQHILPSKPAGDIPAIRYIKDTTTTVYIPDLFLLLDSTFWSPFSLWLLTSLLLPLTLSYFINIPLKTHPAHNYNTRRATIKASPQMQFDPLVFNVAKALIAYTVYAQHTSVLGLYQHATVATVNQAVYGGYAAIITESAVGALISLYEAVLKK